MALMLLCIFVGFVFRQHMLDYHSLFQKHSCTYEWFSSQKGNSMSNHPMISPTISDLRWLVKSLTLHTASLLLVYCILKVTAHFIGYFSRNSISNFQKFLKKFQNRTFLKFVPSKHFLITFLVNVQST